VYVKLAYNRWKNERNSCFGDMRLDIKTVKLILTKQDERLWDLVAGYCTQDERLWGPVAGSCKQDERL
jgi:hypothetical protein